MQKVLWNLSKKGFILNMEMYEEDDKPIFHMTTTEQEFKTPLTKPEHIVIVNTILRNMGTGHNIEFKDYGQYNNLIQAVLKSYLNRYRNLKVMHYDNTTLNATLDALDVTDAGIAECAGIGKSTVNDLTRGITTHPTVKTLSAITKAIDGIMDIKRMKA